VAPQPGIQNQQVVKFIPADLRTGRALEDSAQQMSQVRGRGARWQRHLLDQASSADHQQPHPIRLAVGRHQYDIPIGKRRQPLLNADDLLDITNPVAQLGGLFEPQLLA